MKGGKRGGGEDWRWTFSSPIFFTEKRDGRKLLTLNHDLWRQNKEEKEGE